MLKRYYRIDEAAEFLSSDHKQPVGKEDVLELAARGELRLCAWFKGTLGVFALEDEDVISPPLVRDVYYGFAGYVQIPRSKITPQGGASDLREVVVLDTVSEMNPNRSLPEPSSWGDFICAWSFDTDEDRLIPVKVPVNCDDALVPAGDLLELSTSARQLSRAMATKEKRTLLVIIHALCKDANIRYQKGNGVPKQIEAMTERIGAKVSDDTIRKVLDSIEDALEFRQK